MPCRGLISAPRPGSRQQRSPLASVAHAAWVSVFGGQEGVQQGWVVAVSPGPVPGPGPTGGREGAELHGAAGSAVPAWGVSPRVANLNFGD